MDLITEGIKLQAKRVFEKPRSVPGYTFGVG
jgi:hypothetical protein